jgi:hypothetical protein
LSDGDNSKYLSGDWAGASNGVECIAEIDAVWSPGAGGALDNGLVQGNYLKKRCELRKTERPFSVFNDGASDSDIPIS